MQYYARLSGRDASKSTIENLVRNCLDFYENFTLLAKTQNKKDNQEASVMEASWLSFLFWGGQKE